MGYYYEVSLRQLSNLHYGGYHKENLLANWLTVGPPSFLLQLGVPREFLLEPDRWMASSGSRSESDWSVDRR